LKAFFIVFGAVLSALLVFGAILALPSIYKEIEASETRLDPKAARGIQDAEQIISELETLNKARLQYVKAQLIPSPEIQVKILVEINSLKERAIENVKQYGSYDRMGWADEMIKQLDEWTREWRTQ